MTTNGEFLPSPIPSPRARSGGAAMFQGSAEIAMADRTVGVLERKDGKIQAGYTLFCMAREQYLIDGDGRVVHEWRSQRDVFSVYLSPDGLLLRDGSENVDAPCFKAGGAAGVIEVVTWNNEPVWSYNAVPYSSYLSHHDLEFLPNGHVLMLCWARKSKEEAIAAGRRPDLLPEDEVWDNIVYELAPDGKGSANIVWQWSLWDHLVQDYDPSKANYGDVRAHPELFDINFCPAGGVKGQRNRDTLKEDGCGRSPAQLEVPMQGNGKTGGKDWIHANSVSWDPVRDQVVVSFNVPNEIVVVDHSTSMEEAAGHTGGKRGKGGDILFRYGNPQVPRRGTELDHKLFNQHSVNFLRGVPGEGNILLFNNGRAPDRHWSSVDEYALPDKDGVYPDDASAQLVWSFGPKIGRAGSFYCTHISGCQRLPNGNTLITLGPQGTLVEVTKAGEEVWRYVSPVLRCEGAVAFARQGDVRVAGAYSLFRALRYTADFPAFSLPGVTLVPGRYLEA